MGLVVQLLISLVVEPTPLKNIIVKLGSSSPGFGVKIKNRWNHQPVIFGWFDASQRLKKQNCWKGGAAPCLLFLLWLNASKGPQCVWPAATAVCSLFWWHRKTLPSSPSTNPTIYGKTNVRSLNTKKQQAPKFFWGEPKKQQTKNNFSIQEAHTNQPRNKSKIEQNTFRWPCKNNIEQRNQKPFVYVQPSFLAVFHVQFQGSSYCQIYNHVT